MYAHAQRFKMHPFENHAEELENARMLEWGRQNQGVKLMPWCVFFFKKKLNLGRVFLSDYLDHSYLEGKYYIHIFMHTQN